MKRLRTWSMLSLCSMIASLSLRASAQTLGRVERIVRDSATAAPLANATITAVGTKSGTTTNDAGRFTLRVPAGTYIIRAQRIGFAVISASVAVTNGGVATADFRLPARAVQLDAVVSVGYGTQRKRDLTGAVTSVNTDALANSPIVSIDQLLAGTAPGVAVSSVECPRRRHLRACTRQFIDHG